MNRPLATVVTEKPRFRAYAAIFAIGVFIYHSAVSTNNANDPVPERGKLEKNYKYVFCCDR